MTERAVDAAGVSLAVEESGSGPAVVLVHGTATGRTIWRETVTALARDDLRTLAYDRRAYGTSGAPEPYTGTTVAEQADDLAALIRRLDAAPAVLCGHHLGALIALDVLLREPELACAAVLIDPPMLWLSAEGPDAVGRTRDAVERGARDGGPAGAVDAYLEDAGGPGTALLLGSDRIEASRVNPRAFAADLAAGASWPAGIRDLRRIEAPVIVLTGARSPPIYSEVARSLAALLRNATVEALDAGHFGQVEAPEAVAAAIRRAATRSV